MAHTIEILKGLRDRYESHHSVTITDQALVAAANMADRYIADRFLPDKAIDLIDEAGSKLRIRRMDTPPEYKQLEEQIVKVRRDKESALDRSVVRRGRAPPGEGEAAPRAEDRRRSRSSAPAVPTCSTSSTRRSSPRCWPCGRASPSTGSPRRRRPSSCAWRTSSTSGSSASTTPSRRCQPGRAPHPCRPQGPEASRRLVHLPRPVGRGEDRAGEDAGRVPVLGRVLDDHPRHVRVHGEAHRVPARRLAPRLRRVRGGWPAHRGGAAQAVLDRAVRRDREGPPRRVQHAAADPGGRSPDRLARAARSTSRTPCS